MTAIDALTMEDRQRRVRWTTLTREHAAARDLVVALSRTVAAGIPAPMAMVDLRQALRELDAAISRLESFHA